MGIQNSNRSIWLGEKLVKFDEMIMMNFTIMGPVYPLNEMFECMDAKDLDFWE